MGIRIAYSYLLYFSEQLSCIKFFHPTYGLKDIYFLEFKSFSGFSVIHKATLSRIVSLTGQTYRWGPTVSFDWSNLTSGSHRSVRQLIKTDFINPNLLNYALGSICHRVTYLNMFYFLLT